MKTGDLLLEMRDINIEGHTDEQWFPIIKSVNLQLHRGEVLGLIGESGAGKSTLGLAAMGFVRDGVRIRKGTINFDGIDLINITAHKKRSLLGHRIAYVAQSAAASFNPAHRLINQHIEARLGHKIGTKAEGVAQAIDFYRRLCLPEPEKIGLRYPHQVSGGQLQRAMTAMAMSCNPDLIIFDEPTTALDVTTQIEVLVAIRDIVEQSNTAAIYITHDLAVVAQMADRIKVLLRGEEVEEAPTRKMLSAPRENYTKSLWSVRNFKRDKNTNIISSKAVPVICAEDVSAFYGKKPILFDVSFDIYAGKTVAVVGNSGSGKSTMARCITGLLPPQKGKISFKGAPLAANYRNRSIDDLRQIQMIYQSADTALNARKTIGEIIGRPVQFYTGLKGKKKRARVEELIEQIELDPATFYSRFPTELSGGQKQRVGIARALAANPQFIICDEVTSALDNLVAEEILKLLARLQKELDLAYMFITHDLATVRAIADEVVVLKDGRVVEIGPTDEMFSPPHHPYTDLLLSSVPEMDPDWLSGLLKTREHNKAFDSSKGKRKNF